jgi:hypothetical protein
MDVILREHRMKVFESRVVGDYLDVSVVRTGEQWEQSSD